ncbi:unnamed protein product [Brassica napus]|uniref:(rape) hypothetical protein n=1 Tax=Brassica napus TaxID=3708 RepID=A0A816I2N2_BRANA|nr:unnamed protein product [Brassica napus]
MSETGATCRRTREDRISFLPDHLLCEILSDVPTKTAVVTSVLSTRWRTIWLSTPVLDLHTHDFPNFTAFASFISSNPYYLIKKWINNAVTRKVQHLDILYPWFLEKMPPSIYTCESLVSLKLSDVLLADSEYFSIPCLKIMHLVNSIYTNGAFLEKLISSCPVLEDLTVVKDRDAEYDFEALRVRSQSLKSLVVDIDGHTYMDSENTGKAVVIDAPGLNYLSLKDKQSTSFVISKLSLSAKVNVNVSFDMDFDTDVIDSSKRSVVRTFFTMLSTELEEFKMNDLLVLSSSSVPECLRSSLEHVEIKTLIRGAVAEMELVKYFLENSAVLKKLKLCLRRGRMNEESIILMELLGLRRCSPSCEVVVQLEELKETSLKL